MDRTRLLENPFRPGAGYRPPVLAGREKEQAHFKKLLRQSFATENILITGLRGFGKTVLLDDLKRLAIADGWVWVGNDLSESSSISEDRLALRILTDLANAVSDVMCDAKSSETKNENVLDQSVHDELECTTFNALKRKYETTPGLPSDKLKVVLQRIGSLLVRANLRGVVLAYDEAQCLSDHKARNEFPMSMLVESVGALQKRDGVCPILLVLSGLPHVFNALIAARTYTERMFHVMRLERLSRNDTATALIEPIKPMMPPLNCPPDVLTKVVDFCGGYPYLIQFFGKELIDETLRNGGVIHSSQFPTTDIMDRLDAGLFAARWNNASDNQRRLLKIIATTRTANAREFSPKEIAALCAETDDMEGTQVNQILVGLCEKGLLYRSRHGYYAFTVPMSEEMVRRRLEAEEEVEDSWLNPPPLEIPVESEVCEPEPEKPQKRSWFRLRN